MKIRDNLDDKSFEILLGDDEGDCNRIKVYARKNGVKDFWFEEIKKYVPSAFEKFEKKLEEENPKSIGVNCKKIKLENQDQSEEETKKSIQLKKVN